VADIPAEKCVVWSFPEDDNRRFDRGGEYQWPNLQGRSGEIIDASRFPSQNKPGSDELALMDLREGWYGITDTVKKIGFGLTWDLESFPYLWFWQAFGVPGYPYFGRTYNCAIEPWNSYPLFGIDATIKHGTSRTLGPGETKSTWLKAVAYTGVERVGGITPEGKVLAR
jgi:hypothetical protein